jgi:hypothetical protein
MKKHLTRKEAIDYLVEKDFEFIKKLGEDAGDELLYSYLEDGFKGYGYYTDDELQDEIKERRIVELMDMAEISVSRVPCNSEQGA